MVIAMKNNPINEALENAETITPEIKSEVDLICMNDIESKPIEWLWKERIACGKLTVIAGNAGLGKSQITAYFAKVITTGDCFHNENEPTKIGSVIFLSAEDDPADTIKPRLVAVGADVSLCHVLSAINTQNQNGKAGKRNFDLTQDIEQLGKICESFGDVRLIVIDPISAYLGNTDSNNNSDIRGLLMPLSDMAAKHGVALIVLTHLNKSTSQDAHSRVIGSVGLVAAARAAYMVQKDIEKPEIRYFVPIKNNIGNDYDGFAFNIEGVDLENDIKTSKICWQSGTVEAQKILNPQAEEKPTATNGAADFLRELLANAPMLASDIFSEAEGAGYSKAAIQRAAKRLGIIRKKLGMADGWQWSLQKQEDCEDAEDNINFGVAPSETTLQPS
jgi:putative DNA primase/helicase